MIQLTPVTTCKTKQASFSTSSNKTYNQIRSQFLVLVSEVHLVPAAQRAPVLGEEIDARLGRLGAVVEGLALGAALGVGAGQDGGAEVGVREPI